MTKGFFQIRDSIREQLSSFQETDDTPIDNKYIEDKIIDVRNELITDEWRNKMLGTSYYQEIGPIVVSSTKKQFNVNGITITTSYVITSATIPVLHRRIGWDNINYLGFPDYETNFDRRTLTGFIAMRGERFLKGFPTFTLFANELLFKNVPADGKKILISRAILDDPRQGNGFDPMKDFPCPDPQKLELLVIKHIVSSIGFSPDKINDGTNNTQPIPQQNQQNQ